MNFLRLLDQLVVPFTLLFLFVGSLGGFALGCALLLRTAPALRFIHGMNRWVSTRRASRELEIPRASMLPSKWLGLFLVAGAALTCYFLLVRLQVPRDALSIASPKFAVALAVESVKWLLVAGSLLAVAVGILVLFFPQGLAALEAGMNRWVSTRAAMPAGGDRMRAPLDLVVEAYPRATGWVMALSSLLVAAAMGLMIAAHWLR